MRSATKCGKRKYCYESAAFSFYRCETSQIKTYQREKVVEVKKLCQDSLSYFYRNSC